MTQLDLEALTRVAGGEACPSSVRDGASASLGTYAPVRHVLARMVPLPVGGEDCPRQAASTIRDGAYVALGSLGHYPAVRDLWARVVGPQP
jgi:hypothetical protein